MFGFPGFYLWKSIHSHELCLVVGVLREAGDGLWNLQASIETERLALGR